MITGRALITWPLLGALLAIFGTAGFALTLGDDQTAARDRFIEGLTPSWRALALMQLIVSPWVLVGITAGMADTSWPQAIPLVPEVLRQSYAGSIWEWRLPLSVLLAIAAFWPLRPILAACSMLLMSGVALLLESLTSHAIDSGHIAVVVDFVHQIAAASWFGAVFGLWLGARHERLGISWIERVAPWVSRLAGWTVAALILSGLFTAYRGLAGDPSRLLYAIYGRTLIVKLGAASLVLLIGAYNRFVLMPELNAGAHEQLLRNVGLETILLSGVIGLAALLANTPPAH